MYVVVLNYSEIKILNHNIKTLYFKHALISNCKDDIMKIS